MSMSVGASSSNALSYLQSLMRQGGTKEAKKSDPLSMLMQAISGNGAATAQAGTAASATKTGSSASSPPFSADTMSALLSAQSQQPADSPSAKLFAKLDADGDGQISKTEFGDAASKAGAESSLADAVFARIDGDSDGAISQGELTKADHGGHHRATVQSSTNADGSTEMMISYADGSKAELTSWAIASAGSRGPAGLVEQLVRLQAQVQNLATSTMSALA